MSSAIRLSLRWIELVAAILMAAGVSIVFFYPFPFSPNQPLNSYYEDLLLFGLIVAIIGMVVLLVVFFIVMWRRRFRYNEGIKGKEDRPRPIVDYKLGLETGSIAGISWALVRTLLALILPALFIMPTIRIGSFQQILLSELISGILLGIILGLSLEEYYAKLPTRNAITKSIIIAVITYCIIEALEITSLRADITIEFLPRYLAANLVSYLVLGAVLGYFYGRLHQRKIEKQAQDTSTSI